MASGKATLHELGTFYSIEDAYLLLEMAAVDAYNQRLSRKRDE